MKSIVATLLLIVSLLPLRAEDESGLCINEIQVSNLDQYVDPSWNYGSWIEIYNGTSASMNLIGYWVSDNPAKPRKIRFTRDIIVPAKGYKVLWFEHHDKYCQSQIKMKLSPEGGSFCLSNPSGTIVSELAYPPIPPRASFARTTDGGDTWSLCNSPTPGGQNGADAVSSGTGSKGNPFCTERLAPPVVSKESQLFSGRMVFRVEIPEGCILRYTTDGSAPTPTNGSQNANGYFVITTSTVFRFALFREGYLSSPVVTRSFLLDDKKFTLPIMSVVSAPQNLYSDSIGIFVKGKNGRPGLGQSVACNWNMDWDRPCNFELLDAKGHPLINQEAEIKRCGGWSRAYTPYSFKIHATKYYEGKKTLDYPFFEAKPYLRHKTLQMRNGGNVDYKCRVKDPFLQQIVATSGLDIDYLEYQPVAHYINGVYKGVINMREPSNKHHVYANYGLDEDEIDLFEMNIDSAYIQQCGDNTVWKKIYNLSRMAFDEKVYQRICELIDVDEFCNYIAVELYLGCTDWPQNNLKSFRPRMEGGRYRFILYDLDSSFRTESPFLLFEGKKSYTFHVLFDGPVNQITQEIDVVTIFHNLLRNQTFRKHFIDTFCLVVGSVFDPSRCEEIMRRLASRVNDMQLLDDNGYNRNVSPWETTNSLISTLKKRQAPLIQSLKEYRPLVLNKVEEQQVLLESDLSCARLQVNGQVVPTGRFSGTLFPPVTLRASAPQGYRFVGWYQVFDSETTNCVSGQPEMEMPETTDALHLIACFERSTGADGKGGRKQVVINEVSAGNSIYVNEYFKKNDWIELYNLTDEDVDLEGMFLSDNPDHPQKCCITGEGAKVSTILPAHGFHIVWCDKLPSESQLHASFKLENSDGAMVLLTASDLSWSDTLNYCAHDGMQSVGRFPDGGEQVFRMPHPTIGRENAMNSYATEWLGTNQSGDGLQNLQLTHASDLSLSQADNSLHIRSESHSSVRLRIFAADGKAVLSRTIETGSNHSVVGLSPLLPGIYVAQAEDSQGNRCTIRFAR
ncbi:MAG: CotH kinase family protein [Bacteroidaceae bacterium]|nr:CotH kinase family protein [Bacteroidaceae bacterium]